MDHKTDNGLSGLTSAEVEERVRRGEVNTAPQKGSRSVAAILRENIFTLFNAILGALLVLVLVFGNIRDALFGLVLVGNALIGIVQELRAKRTLDRLTVLSASRADVLRDGQEASIPMDDVVLGDVVHLKRGDQVVADGEVLAASGLEVDESLLTGEADPVDKQAGNNLMSGSFAVAGSGYYRATAVGSAAYARKLTAQARRYKPVRSELRHGINRILAGITWVMIPVGLLLFWRELSIADTSDAVSGSTAAMVGMIPQGLVLLTSIAFAVAVVVLGKRRVLVQELPAVEGLARVDIVCFDKTGTLTEPGLQFGRLEAVGQGSEREAARALGALAADPASRNPTMDAIASAYPVPEAEPDARIPFSSERKWSSVSFGGQSWVLGAPEILLAATEQAGREKQESAGTAGSDADPGAGGQGADTTAALAGRVRQAAASGQRVLLLSNFNGIIKEDKLPAGLQPGALVLLQEKVRADAADTLAYFARQGVKIKVISGDNPVTVSAVARRAGVEDAGDPVDARTLPQDPQQLADVLEGHTVFGRVTAKQKQEMVHALQSRGHDVVMTGDGVNDTLAVKQADIGIAVGSGAAAATKSVAELVLLDGRFETLPGVVAEGRRVIADIERVAYLFITKTAYATVLAIVIGILGWEYPFLPRHMTLVDAVTIGIPAFFLALAPSKQRYRPGFVGRVLRFTIPAGILLAGGTLATYALSRAGGADLAQSRTLATLALTIMGLCVLVILARPLTVWRILLILAMAGLVVLASITPLVRSFLSFEYPSTVLIAEAVGVVAVTIGLLAAMIRIAGLQPWKTAEQ